MGLSVPIRQNPSTRQNTSLPPPAHPPTRGGGGCTPLQRSWCITKLPSKLPARREGSGRRQQIQRDLVSLMLSNRSLGGGANLTHCHRVPPTHQMPASNHSELLQKCGPLCWSCFASAAELNCPRASFEHTEEMDNRLGENAVSPGELDERFLPSQHMLEVSPPV